MRHEEDSVVAASILPDNFVHDVSGMMALAEKI